MNAVNFALLVARIWVGAVMLAHGYRHVKSLQSGPGMANWLTSLGLKYGPLQAQTLTWTEVAVAPFLAAGLLTPAAYGAAASLMLVAWITNHRDKTFFITARPTEGWEYVATLAILSLVLGTLTAGDWSIDSAIGWSWMTDPSNAIWVTIVVGIGGTAGYLGTFWRPPAKARDQAAS
jgi:putative oxidoreductase